MIKKLRTKFIRIAMLSVVLVMALLTGILNAGNYISVNNDLKTTLVMISENPELFERRGERPDGPAVPGSPWDVPEGEKGRKENWDFSGDKGPFNRETLYSLRFFTLSFDESGNLLNANLDNIAAVDAGGTDAYLAAALKKGEGFGFLDGYKYYVYSSGGGEHTAVFLSAFRELRTCRSVLLVSLLAAAVCILLV